MSDESWRPRLHLAPQNGSISDPNGLNQFKGTYHFFCQNAPTYPPDVDSYHGWGHFASRDLVNWVFLGCHIMPDCPSDKDGSYSGGAYVNEDADELWIYYTGNVRDGEGDGTYSGRLANQTLMKSYNGINMGPKEVVLDNSGYPAYCSCHVRDPKVWKQDGALHMMLGARTRADSRGGVMCYRSEDGYTWEMEGSITNLGEKPFGYMWECPDRIVLDGREFLGTCPQGMAHAGDADDPTKFSCQNVHAAGYFPIEGTVLDAMHQDTERFDASAPHPAIDESTFRDWDFGFDFYACQSFVDEKGRTILIGWMSLPHDEFDARPYDNPTPTWRGCLTIPRELTYSAEKGVILQNPVAEFDALRGEAHPFEKVDGSFAHTLSPKLGDVVIEGASDGVLSFNDELELRIHDGDAELAFTSDQAGQGRMVRRAHCGAVSEIRAVVDQSVIEIYLNHGETVFGTRFFSTSKDVRVTWSGEASSAVAYDMTPITINYLVER